MNLRASHSKFGIVLLFIFTGALCSCAPARKVTRTELVGTYLAEYQHGNETLILNGDGVFSQRYLDASNKQTSENQGSWSYNSDSNKVYLGDVVMFTNFDGSRPSSLKKTNRVYAVNPDSNTVELIIDNENTLFYQKMK